MGCRRAPAKVQRLEQDMEQHLKAIVGGFLAFNYFEAEAATRRALEASVPQGGPNAPQAVEEADRLLRELREGI
jgi:hypothetical protein